MREATQDDLGRLEELEAELFFDNCMSRLRLASELQHGRGWVVEDGGVIVAYSLLRFEPRLVDLTRLGVATTHQGLGLGTYLLNHALQQGESVMLTVHRDNETAIRLYLRHGFRVIGILPHSWLMRTIAP